jgi:hypothetical protein
MLALLATFFMASFVFRNPGARREALSWMTLGHAEQVLDASRRAEAIIQSLR